MCEDKNAHGSEINYGEKLVVEVIRAGKEKKKLKTKI